MSALHVIFGAGVLGRTIAAQLVQAGQMVRLVSRGGTNGGIAEVQGHAADAMEPGQARAACRGGAVVYQCAAPAYHKWERDFPPLQENILRAAGEAGAVLVVAENLYGYGVPGTLSETSPLIAMTRKGRTRAAMSRRLFEASANGQIRAVSGRASDFFGPGVTLSMMGESVWPRLLAGKPIDWFGDPDQPHSLTYLPDFARALIRLGQEQHAWGRAWHVPSQAARSPRDVLEQAAALARQVPPRFRPTPAWLLRIVGLIIPAAGEMVEMGYSYRDRFEMDDSDWRRTFAERPTDWDSALRATIGYWRGLQSA